LTEVGESNLALPPFIRVVKDPGIVCYRNNTRNPLFHIVEK